MGETPTYCSRCGARLAPEARFCVECGAEVVAAPAAVTPPYVPAPDVVARPPGRFPWGVCAVIVGVVVVVLMVTAVVVVGWFVFRHPPTSVTPERLRQATGESEPSATVSAEEAIARVKARPEVSAFLQMGPNPGATPRVELAREDGGSYVVHAYTELTQAPQGSPATLDFGWYRVSKTTGEVTQVPGP